MLKVKLFFIFEEKDNAISMTFKEILKLPFLTEDHFPKFYFKALLEMLTIDQKKLLKKKFG